MYLLLLITLFLPKTTASEDCGNAVHFVNVSTVYSSETSSCTTVQNQIICSSFVSAIKLYAKNQTCVRILDDQVLLHESIVISHIHDFYIVNWFKLQQVNITCSTKNQSGLSFVDARNVFISDVLFKQCGVKQSSTSYPASSAHQNVTPPISTALYFKKVKNINFHNVQFLQSFGYGVVMYDVSGLISFQTVTITGGKIVPYCLDGIRKEGYFSGGGIYIEYTRNASRSDTSNAIIKLHKCYFFANQADTVSAKPIGEGLAEGHVPFGRGAGLTVFFMGQSKNNSLTISNSSFSRNIGAWGGAVYVRFRHKASNINVTISNVNFSLNNATYAGGAIIVTSTQLSAEPYNNTITIKDSEFLRNIAKVGGAYSQQRIDLDFRKEEKTLFMNCNFVKNNASMGASIQLKHVQVRFVNVNITDSNSHVQDALKFRHGGVYAFESSLHFCGRNQIRGNRGTALILDCSDVYVKDYVLFSNNSGNNGGALSLFGHSKIYLYNSTSLMFSNNTALNNGGAINVNIPGPAAEAANETKPKIYECFFLFHGSHKLESPHTFQGHVTFLENHALRSGSGDSIFATTLKDCKSVTDDNIHDVIFKWNNFGVPSGSIATLAVKIHLNEIQWHVSPGTLFSPTISLYDEFNNPVNDTVDVRITNRSTCIRIETNKRFVVTKNKITLRFLSCSEEYKRLGNSKINIHVSSVNQISTSATIYNVSLKSCYFGYSFQGSQCHCNIKKNQAKGIAFCLNHNTYLFKGRWTDPKIGTNQDLEETQVCPAGYCKPCPSTYTKYACLYHPDKNEQCGIGRDQTSLLCSKCKENFSVSLGGEACLYCKGGKRYNAIWYITVIIVVISAFILFVIWLNVDIYSNYLNGCLYYYQVITLLKTSSLQLEDPIKSFIGILNIESPGSVFSGKCLFDGLDDLQKNAFNYIIPVWMILFLVIIDKYAKHHPDSYFSRQNCFRAFTIISVTAYSDFTRITFKLLEYVEINKEKRVQIYAALKWNEGEHKVCVIFGFIAIIVVVIGGPMILIFSSWLSGLHCRYFVNPFARYKPIIDCFKMCFKHKHTWFASYYFLCRTILLSIGTFVPKSPFQNVIMAASCFIIFVFFAMNLPYRYKWMNWYDIMILVNLTTVSILALGMRSSRTDLLRNVCGQFTRVLIYIPIVIVLGRLIYVYGPKFYHFCKDKYISLKNNKKNVEIPKRSLQKENELEENF